VDRQDGPSPTPKTLPSPPPRPAFRITQSPHPAAFNQASVPDSASSVTHAGDTGKIFHAAVKK
jgi:hypothetical protein